MNSKIYRAGVVGCGFIGVAHIEALRRLGNVNVVALSDNFGANEKAQQLFLQNSYDDYKKMIDNENLDTIHICTPNSTHFEITKYAMERGVHVICEKPMTSTLSDAIGMVELANSTKLINAVNFHNRFYPMTNYMKNIIKNNEIGNVMSIHGGYIQDWLLYETDYSWRLLREYSGKTRCIADIGSHWMDLIQFVTGLKIIEVFADFTTFYETRKLEKNNSFENLAIDTEDFAVINLRLENGAICSGIISQMYAGEKNKISLNISGTKASLSWDSNSLNSLQMGYRDKPNEIIEKDVYLLSGGSEQLISYPAGHVEGFPDAFKQTFKKIYEAIGGSKQKEYATFEDGLNQVILAEKLFESANTKRWVKNV